ncbi:unnamed protein product [Mesocestoides corti]|uniref:Secreted protein n=1 Tax=Mesocestoides corti TaxID=53468 RepID=A0A0R3UIL3_MESCO|nr:unnamed protein product [Mesocestoides corti]
MTVCVEDDGSSSALGPFPLPLLLLSWWARKVGGLVWAVKVGSVVLSGGGGGGGDTTMGHSSVVSSVGAQNSPV